MITIKNIQTGETKNVYNTEFVNGYVRSNMDKPLGKRFINGWAGILTELKDADGQQAFMLSADWDVVTGKGERKQRQPKAKKDEPKAEPQPTKDEPTKDEQPETVDVTDDEPKATKTVEEYENEIAATYGTIGVGIFQKAVEYVQANYTAALDEDSVRRIAESIFAEYAASEPEKMKAAKKAAKKATKDGKKKYRCADFDDMKADLEDGFYIYLHGPAGSGKSYTAEELAEELGLDFYGQTTIQFAHDVRGYGDAGGNFQETPFYKAFAFGGLYFQDEYDRSNAEAAIVLNSALANGWYDFPIVGRVEAHPDFHFMAAGNTLMTGPDEEYITGQEIDPSSRDRFATFYEVGYNHDVELNEIANGDEVLIAFVEDVRQAIQQTGIKHVVSYRATKYMTARKDTDKANVLDRCTFKGLDVDARREIYERLNDRTNVWAKALKKLI